MGKKIIDKLSGWAPVIGILIGVVALGLAGVAVYGAITGSIATFTIFDMKVTALLLVLLGNQIISNYGIGITNDILLHTMKKLDRMEYKIEGIDGSNIQNNPKETV